MRKRMSRLFLKNKGKLIQRKMKQKSVILRKRIRGIFGMKFNRYNAHKINAERLVTVDKASI